MKVLGSPRATPEQLRIIGDTRVGIEIIRGAAGSGKTTTALLRLRNLSDMFRSQHSRTGSTTPVKALVLTYNRTLRGYVEALAREQASRSGGVDLTVSTYAQWAVHLTNNPQIHSRRSTAILGFARQRGIKLQNEFLFSEIEYILGRFSPKDYDSYLDVERTGRGIAPRVERATRERLLAVINDYRGSIKKSGRIDWEDLPQRVRALPAENYEIIVVDEAQDFSANQLRSVVKHLAPTSALTLVLDTAQRLYPRGYTWAEAGIDARQARFYRLEQNHRNTIEIANFARGLLSGLTVDDDGTLPDLKHATRHGPPPLVLLGKYSAQLDAAISYIKGKVNLDEDKRRLCPRRSGAFVSRRPTVTSRSTRKKVCSSEKGDPKRRAQLRRSRCPYGQHY
ncbi:AAA family ATPase [Bradyrhizobium uaiense]|uniref:AAA family ATPase n=1 Tax=Bradyrhizobium uaiense TaxID=2594946 RepID=A0A6P1BJV1_9BRAD|nr:AAA family ATPase [Bradyrhizobium uaiense]NEU98479.1 AAA family ATPase [Bradyrhizobium uaiense]